MLGYTIREVETEQWLGSEWVVRDGDGNVVHSAGAEGGQAFGRLHCRIWVLLHVVGLA